MSYRFPKSLELLDFYLRALDVDTSKLTSDRHALALLRKHTKFRFKFPKRGKSCYMELRKMHRRLFPTVPMKKRPSKPRRVRGIGQTGPASDCRTVTPEVFKAIAAKFEKAA